MFTQNIRRINNENLMDDCILDNHSRLTVVMLVSSMNKDNKEITENIKKFIELATYNLDVMYVFVNINDFQETQRKYLTDIKTIFKFLFYYNRVNMATINGCDFQTIQETTHFLKQKIYESIVNLQKQEAEKQKQLILQNNKEHANNLAIHMTQQKMDQQNQQILQPHLTPKQNAIPPNVQLLQQVNHQVNQQQDQLQEKIELLKKLHILKKDYNVELTQNFGIESSLNDLINEYNSIVSKLNGNISGNILNAPQININSVLAHDTLSVNSNPASHTSHNSGDLEETAQMKKLRKQEKLKKIQELSNMTSVIRMQQTAKLQQLMMLQKKKEEDEENRRKNRHTS